MAHSQISSQNPTFMHAMQIWDLRKLNQPTQVFNDLPAHIATTQCCFSPDQKLVLTGISATPKQPTGALVFLDIASQRLVRRVALPGSVAAVTWHERLNQIFVGTGMLIHNTSLIWTLPNCNKDECEEVLPQM